MLFYVLSAILTVNYRTAFHKLARRYFVASTCDNLETFCKFLNICIIYVVIQQFRWFYKLKKGQGQHDVCIGNNGKHVSVEFRPFEFASGKQKGANCKQSTIIDTTDKPYATRIICGFSVKHEMGLFTDTPELIRAFEMDLTQVNVCLHV